jgi:hypothetical protein
MIMKRNLLLGALLLASQVTVTVEMPAIPGVDAAKKAYEFVKGHVVEASTAALVAAILARPVYHLVMDKLIDKKECSCYGLDSVIGGSVEKKEDGRVKVQAHVGSVDAKVSVPTVKAFPLGQKKRSAQALLDAFKPHLEFGIDDKTTPIISDETLVDTPKVKRIFAKFSLGPWSARVACDVADLVIVPAAMIAIHLIQKNMPSLSVNTSVAPADAPVVTPEA